MPYIILDTCLTPTRANCSKGQDAKPKPSPAHKLCAGCGRGVAEVLGRANKVFLGVKPGQAFFNAITKAKD